MSIIQSPSKIDVLRLNLKRLIWRLIEGKIVVKFLGVNKKGKYCRYLERQEDLRLSKPSLAGPPGYENINV